MIPVRTRASNFVYRGPTPDVGDAWVERRPTERAVMLTWKPSDEERDAIAGGGLIELGLFGPEPIYPVSLGVSSHPEISAIGAVIRDRAIADLRNRGIGPAAIPPGHWAVSDDVWEDLEGSAALDPPNGVPTLFGRPLVRFPGPKDSIEYVPARPQEAAPFA